MILDRFKQYYDSNKEKVIAGVMRYQQQKRSPNPTELMLLSGVWGDKTIDQIAYEIHVSESHVKNSMSWIKKNLNIVVEYKLRNPGRKNTA